jgi:formiminotetrahydrofolate cyclodeaminase
MLEEAREDRKRLAQEMAELAEENRMLWSRTAAATTTIPKPTSGQKSQRTEEAQVSSGPAAKEVARIRQFVRELKREAEEVGKRGITSI